MKWQPIETAPEGCDDEILVFKPGVGRIIVRWLGDDHPDSEGQFWHESWSHQAIEGATHWMELEPAPIVRAAASIGEGA